MVNILAVIKHLNNISNPINEHFIQNVIARNRTYSTRYTMMIPNCYTIHDNEADMLAIRKSGYYDEFEIKISRSDFKLDESKQVYIDIDNKRTKVNKSRALTNGSMSNYFWYCVPENLITIDEVPEYAGLIYIYPSGYLREIKQPKKLHNNKMNIETQFKHVKKLGYRYWDNRLKI